MSSMSKELPHTPQCRLGWKQNTEKTGTQRGRDRTPQSYDFTHPTPPRRGGPSSSSHRMHASCVCVCVSVCQERDSKRPRKKKKLKHVIYWDIPGTPVYTFRHICTWAHQPAGGGGSLTHRQAGERPCTTHTNTYTQKKTSVAWWERKQNQYNLHAVSVSTRWIQISTFTVVKPQHTTQPESVHQRKQMCEKV